ncbi:MAG TPA: serine hydrolase domain-containing protein [Candidatus Binataceae bacterium]|nr:serine hydrolase domain-containing protein [Candidatus Binataceae bacterium]
MPAPHFFAQRPEDIGLNPDKVRVLFDRAEREIKEGLLPACQLAIARNGKIGAMGTFGRARQGGVERPATAATLFDIMSCTKAITSAAAWLLVQEGKLSPADRVVKFVPEFGTNGKDAVTLEHLLTHTSAIPTAPGAQKEWSNRERRLARFAQWRLEHPPGERFTYHIQANFWPLAEIIERISGLDLRAFVRIRIAEPLGLPDLRIGIPHALNERVAEVAWVGEPAREEDYRQLGIAPPRVAMAALNEAMILEFNEPEVREAGSPAGGGITTAGDLALFYQALLHDGRSYDGKQIWEPAMLRDALRIRNPHFKDPQRGMLANRALGVVIAGDDGKANLRGFGRTNSPATFGHPGFGGQIGWADPASGISFAYLTNGFDRNDLREGRRSVALASLAGACAL